MITRTVSMERETVELYKILKFEGLAGSGGEAKFAISEGLVKVNDQVETRKRRKIIAGDRIQLGETMIHMVCANS